MPDKASVPVKPGAWLSVKANVFTLKLGNIVLWLLIVQTDNALLWTDAAEQFLSLSSGLRRRWILELITLATALNICAVTSADFWKL